MAYSCQSTTSGSIVTTKMTSGAMLSADTHSHQVFSTSSPFRYSSLFHFQKLLWFSRKKKHHMALAATSLRKKITHKHEIDTKRSHNYIKFSSNIISDSVETTQFSNYNSIQNSFTSLSGIVSCSELWFPFLSLCLANELLKSTLINMSIIYNKYGIYI